ncbi:MAG: DVU0524 family FlgM-associated protein [Pseudomonadota bacterium]
MTITSHQIQSVLRTYGKQLRRGMRLNRIKSAESGQAVDKLDISPEARRRQVVERVASEMVYRLSDPEARTEGVGLEIVNELSQDYGQPLTMSYNEEEGDFEFMAVDSESGQIIDEVDPGEKEKLNRRLMEITRKKVDQTMVKG